jgi:hypothetical protein
LHTFDDKDLIRFNEVFGNPRMKIEHPSFTPTAANTPESKSNQGSFLFSDDSNESLGFAIEDEVRAGQPKVVNPPADGSANESKVTEATEGETGPPS